MEGAKGSGSISCWFYANRKWDQQQAMLSQHSKRFSAALMRRNAQAIVFGP